MLLKNKIPEMVTVLPPCKAGSAEIVHRTVSRLESGLSVFQGLGAFCPEGTYAVLHINGEVMMSDTRTERVSNIEVIHEATGDVLIAGFGVGMILIPILRNPKVRTVTVIEINPDVVTLVRPHIERYVGPRAARKLRVVIADVFEWRPEHRGRQFNTIYFDIWPWVNEDILPEMTKLRRAFAPYLRVGGWSRCWKQSWIRKSA